MGGGGRRRAVDLQLKCRRSATLGGACGARARKSGRGGQRRGRPGSRGTWAEVMCGER